AVEGICYVENVRLIFSRWRIDRHLSDRCRVAQRFPRDGYLVVRYYRSFIDCSRPDGASARVGSAAATSRGSRSGFSWARSYRFRCGGTIRRLRVLILCEGKRQSERNERVYL